MHKILLLLVLMAFLFVEALENTGTTDAEDNGGSLFHKHCSACHRHPSRLKSVKNLIAAMRNPPPYMPRFNEEKLSDEDAKKVAEYIYHSSD